MPLITTGEICKYSLATMEETEDRDIILLAVLLVYSPIFVTLRIEIVVSFSNFLSYLSL